ncbi:MAG TPA: hypothetical protein ENK57_03325 [Polyangiaceae bacterium]|nr:hypothetical protein [Polyangiaceae bacterium]
MSDVLKALNAVHRELGPIAKRKVDAGRGGSFQAFAVDDVYAAIGPLLAKHGVVLTSTVDDVRVEPVTFRGGAEGRWVMVRLRYRFTALDGSSIETAGVGEGIDTQDKATNKALQQALKYALVQAFQIATGEPDPDQASAQLEPVTDPMRLIKIEAWKLVDGDNREDRDAAVEEARQRIAAALEALGLTEQDLTDADVPAVVAELRRG